MPALAPELARDLHDRAAGQVLADLIDAALADGILVAEEAGGAAGRGERWADAAAPGGRRLRFRARPSTFPRPWRFSRGPVLLVDPDRPGPPRALDAAGVVRALGRAGWTALDLVCADLAGAADAVARAREAAPDVAAEVAARGLTARAGERLTALADRPFHPLGRHKRGWTRADAARWGPHAAEPFGVAWWAVPRAWLVRPDPPAAPGAPGAPGPLGASGPSDAPGSPGASAAPGPSDAPGSPGASAAPGPSDAPGPPARVGVGPEEVLGATDRERLDEAVRRRGLGNDHVVVPVHPWQVRHLGGPPAGVDPVADDLGRFRATASLRTLVPADRPALHLKLPLGVAALGAGRQLPARYLRNGDRAQGLLAAAARHPALGGRVHVCDETTWWTTPGGAGGLGDGDLGCQLRRYPADLAGDPATVIVPLGAFGATVGGRSPVFDALAAGEGGARGPAVLAALTGELVRLAVVGLAHGVMPELHGQNVVVVLRPGRPGRSAVAGLVLRDHDAVRIHPPWLSAAGLPDPGYVVDGRTPNTLVADSPEALLGWFQMLGVHLGLLPAARAVDPDEDAGWRTVAAATRTSLDDLADSGPDLAPAVALARHQLLAEPAWPVKLVLGPLLERGGACGTSMPSAVGATANPLRGRDR